MSLLDDDPGDIKDDPRGELLLYYSTTILRYYFTFRLLDYDTTLLLY